MNSIPDLEKLKTQIRNRAVIVFFLFFSGVAFFWMLLAFPQMLKSVDITSPLFFIPIVAGGGVWALVIFKVWRCPHCGLYLGKSLLAQSCHFCERMVRESRDLNQSQDA